MHMFIIPLNRNPKERGWIPSVGMILVLVLFINIALNTSSVASDSFDMRQPFFPLSFRIWVCVSI